MKRLVVCCDGTWNTPESTHVTNVVKIARAIKPTAIDGTPQVVFYDWGIGTRDGLDKFQQDFFGQGMDKNIQDAYRFLVYNYEPGDEIYFFGFSRGAYTARSCIGLIRNSWLLRKQFAAEIPAAYHIYRTSWGPDAENARNFREERCHHTDIRFLGVWDTVGALGIPLGLFAGYNGETHGFHNTALSRIVENAYHALGIDERRKPYAPTLWQTHAGRTRTEQCWFTGVHGDIGGGYREAGLSNIPLEWMVTKAAACGLDVDYHYLEQIYRNDPRELLHNPFRGADKALGSQRREIGVTNHDETLHTSAEQRFITLPGYHPRNLATYLARDDQIRLPI